MLRLISAFGVLLLFGACQSSTEPEPFPGGEVVALISGAVDDSFSAVGAEPRRGATFATFASARPGAADGIVLIRGHRERDGSSDVLSLNLIDVTGPGVYPARGRFLYDDPRHSFGPRRLFEFEEGEIEVTSVTDDRIRGEFAAMGVEIMLPPESVPDTTHIRSGRFDVPILR